MPELPPVIWLPVGALTLSAAWLAATAVDLDRTRKLAVGIGLFALMALGVGGYMLPPSALPWAAVNVLHEGPSAQVLDTLYGLNGHAGPLIGALGQLSGPHAPDGLRLLAWVNLLGTAASAVLIVLIAWVRVGHLGIALLAAAGWLAHPGVWHGASSEVGGPLGGLALLAGIAHLGMGPGRDGPRDSAEWGLVGVWGTGVLAWSAVAVAARPELVVAGGALLGTALLQVLPQSAWPHRAASSLRAWVGDDLRTSRRARAVVLSLLVLSLLVVVSGGTLGSRGSWVAAGLAPLHPSITNPMVWLMSSGDLLWTLAALVGVVSLLRRLDSNLLLALAGVVLMRVYAAASHGVWFELQRYLLPVLPLVALAAAVGARGSLDRLVAAGWWPAWRLPLVVGGLLVAVLHSPAGESVHRWPGAHGEFLTIPRLPGLDFDLQREARTLAEAVEAPEADGCHLVLRSWPDLRSRRHPPPQPSRLVWYEAGPGVHRPLAQSTSTADLLEHTTEGCIVYLKALDCSLVAAADTCAADVHGLAAFHSRQWRREPFNDPREYGELQGVVEVAAYRLR